MTYGEMQRDSVFDFCRNQIAIDLHLENWSRSNPNMSIEGQCITLYKMALLNVFHICYRYEIFGVEICMTLILTFRMGQEQMVVYQSNAN